MWPSWCLIRMAKMLHKATLHWLGQTLNFSQYCMTSGVTTLLRACSSCSLLGLTVCRHTPASGFPLHSSLLPSTRLHKFQPLPRPLPLWDHHTLLGLLHHSRQTAEAETRADAGLSSCDSLLSRNTVLAACCPGTENNCLLCCPVF